MLANEAAVPPGSVPFKRGKRPEHLRPGQLGLLRDTPPRRYPEPSIGFHRNGRLIAIHLIQLIEIAVSDTGVILAGVPTGDVIPILISTLTVDCHVACVFLSLSILTSLTARKQSRFHRLPARKTGPFSRYNPYIARHPHRVSPRSSTEKAPDLRRHI